MKIKGDSLKETSFMTCSAYRKFIIMVTMPPNMLLTRFYKISSFRSLFLENSHTFSTGNLLLHCLI